MELKSGIPGMVLLPARNYKFVVSEQVHIITVPRKGSYYDLDSTFFKEDDGEFELYNSETNIMYLPAIPKILFATKKYPDLEDDQYFVPISLVFKEDVVEISGMIISVVY